MNDISYKGPKYEGQVTANIELITPEDAKRYLGNNINNRKVSPTTVRAYARDMVFGNWKLNGEAISFLETGELQNGQHRLQAVIKSNTPTWFLVVRGVKAGSVLDKHKARTTANTMQISGYDPSVRSTTVIGAVKFLYRTFLGIDKVTDNEVMSFIDKYEEEWDAAYYTCSKGASKALAKKAPFTAAIFCSVVFGIPSETIEEFCTIVNTGLCDDKTKFAAVLVRNRLLEVHGTNDYERDQIFRYTLKALRDFSKRIPREKSYRSLDKTDIEKYAEKTLFWNVNK